MNTTIVNTILTRCLGYKKEEQCLIVCDDTRSKLGHHFYSAAQRLGIAPLLLQIKTRLMHGEEPPRIAAESLAHADCAVLLTGMSLSHTKARVRACKKYGTRIASLPGVTEAMLKRAICIDYRALKEHCDKMSRLLTNAARIEITAPGGTHLVLSCKGRKGMRDDGIYTEKGSFGNLPAGEASIGPLEGTANGRLVVDATAPFMGKLKRPIEIVIRDGYATLPPIPQMKPLLKRYGRAVLSVAELGIGANPKARITGIILEDEKALDTAHIAFGNNTSFGGTVACPCHLDFVFKQPVVTADGIPVTRRTSIQR